MGDVRSERGMREEGEHAQTDANNQLRDLNYKAINKKMNENRKKIWWHELIISCNKILCLFNFHFGH